jgi:hypothetical protein
MDQYMRENSVVGMPSEPEAGAAPSAAEGAKPGAPSQKS